MTTANLKAAARLAREASQGRRTIELVVTEEGVVVKGWTSLGWGKRHAAARKVAWPALDCGEDLASNAVMLVDRELSAMEGAK